MKCLTLLPLLAAAALCGCRENPSAQTPPAPAAGAEIALFQIGQSEETVQNAIAAVPNFRRPAGAGFAVIRIGEKKVVLTGGCFQNAYLSSRLICRLRAQGCEPYWHRRVPTNDNGIALGQIMAAARATKEQ